MRTLIPFLAVFLVSSAIAQTDETPNKDLNLPDLVSREETLNDQCRGGSGDNPDTQKICDQRDVAIEELRSRGWCWGPPEAAGYQKHWVQCVEVPRLDPVTYCQNMANSSPQREVVQRECLRIEQQYYNELKSVWANIPPSTSKNCLGMANSISGGSYVILGECIKQELSAAKENKNLKFRY